MQWSFFTASLLPWIEERKRGEKRTLIWLFWLERLAVNHRVAFDVSLFFRPPTTFFPALLFFLCFFCQCRIWGNRVRRLDKDICHYHDLFTYFLILYVLGLPDTWSLLVGLVSFFFPFPPFLLFWLLIFTTFFFFLFVWYEIDGKHYITSMRGKRRRK